MSIDAAFTHFPLTTSRLHLRHIQPTDTRGMLALMRSVTGPMDETSPVSRGPGVFTEDGPMGGAKSHSLGDDAQGQAVIGSCTPL